VEQEGDVELTTAEENEEKEHAKPSLLENYEDIEKSPITTLQCHQTQHKETRDG